MKYKIAVVIPCYKVTRHIEDVVKDIPEYVSKIYTVDDKCPDNSGEFIQKNVKDPRVTVLFNEVNLGVGGATKHGFVQAVKDGNHIMVKIDGDGQMDSSKIKDLITPLINGQADYVKANRFFKPSALKGMPLVRKIGNAGLSFLNKASSGYWNIMDPTNGFLAITNSVLSLLELDKISDRYFFESDMLFRLNLSNCVVKDVPIPAIYGDEESHLKVSQALVDFSTNHLKRLFKRIIYKYFVNDFNVGSIQLVSGSLLFGFGVIYSLIIWLTGISLNRENETGSIMLAVLTIILGFQLLLSFLNIDIFSTPDKPITSLVDDDLE